MKMLMIWALIAGAGAGAAAAAAPAGPHWVVLGPGAGGTVEIDRASLTWRPMQRAWWRIMFPQPKRDGAVQERHLELIDCGSGESAVIATVSLDSGGAVIADRRDGEALAMQRLSQPTPGTTGELVVEQACRLRPPPPPPPRRRR